MDKIFVSLASYVDPVLLFTLAQAYAKADNPERLVFGVVDQHPQSRSDIIRRFKFQKQIRYVHIDPVQSRGVSWARSLVFSLYQNETYLLQIDSHTYFEQGWDSALIEQFHSLDGLSSKPILSTYPYAFEFEGTQPVIKTTPSKETVLALRPKAEEVLKDDDPVLHFRAEHLMTCAMVPGFHLAGGFIFTWGRFVDEVPYDPRLYFHGEEQNLAIRAFTRGWDIFHPPHIPLYHLYKMPDNAYDSHHWHEKWDSQRDYRWYELKDLARQRMADLLYHGKPLGAFGLGSERSLQDFAEFSGIDYAKRSINRNRFPA